MSKELETVALWRDGGGRRTVVGAERAGTPVELADGNGRLAGRPAVVCFVKLL